MDSSLNSVRLHLLKMSSLGKQPENPEELKLALLDSYRQKVDEEAAKLWEDNNLNDAKIEEMLNSER
ncbi:MAG: hypothetical protein LBT50_01640 [Prevotellaceae bacterium]|nr:hypothetical protein [Prevotellaceae bacterium]